MPPVTVRSIAPVELPLQSTFVCVVLALKAAAGCVIVTDAVVVQPLASVTVTVYVPAAKDERSWLVAEFDQL